MPLRMPYTARQRFLSALSLLLFVTALGSAPSARAATLTWVGFAFSWQTPQNWTGNVIPVSGDSLTFTGSTTNMTSFNDAAPLALTIQDLNFGPGAGNFVLTGSAFRLSGGITSTRLGTTTIQNAITLPDANTPQVSVDAGSNLVLTGNITGRNNVLTKVGSGTLTLTGSNNYTRSSIFSSSGKTVIQEGTIVMGNQWALGNIGSAVEIDEFVTIGAAGTLNLNGFQASLRQITPSSSGTIVNGNVFSNTGNNELNSTLAGSASLSVNTSSTVTVNSANSHTGNTNVNSGQLIINNANGLSANSIVSFNSGTLVFAQSATVNASNFTLSVPAANYRVETGGGQTVTLTGNLTDPDFVGFPSNFMKSGLGTLVATQNTSVLDNFWVLSGTVRFSGISNLVAGTGTIRLSSGATLQWAAGSTTDISSRLAIDAGGILDTNGNNVTFATALGGASGITKSGAGTLTLSTTNSYTGGTVVNGGTLKLNAGGAIGAIRGALTINTGATVESAVTNAFGFATGLKVDSVTINGGTLNHTAAADCGWGVAYTLSNGALMTSNGGVSNANATTQFAFGGGTGSNTSVNVTSGTATIAGHVDLRGDNGNTNVNFTVASGATLNLTAGISSHSPDALTVGPVGFTKLGGGTLILTGSNIYSGTTSVNAGVVDFNNANAFGNGGTIAVNSGTLRWTSNTADLSSRLSLGAGGVTFDTNGNTVTFASAISGTGALTKTGAGLLRLSSSNSHSGDTTVNGGVLVLAGPTSTRGQLGGLDNTKITINSGNINLESNNALVGTSPFGNILITINTGGLLSTVNNTTMLSEVLMDGGVIETAGGGDFTNGNYIFSDGLRTAGTGKTSYIQGGAVVLPTAVNVLGGDTLRIASVIMGNNNLVKQGAGTMVLTGSNTFTGTTLVSGGLIEFSSNTNFGNAANKITLNGAGLRWATGNTADISGRLNAFGAGGASFDTNGNNVTLAAAMSGAGALTKNGAGTLRLTGSNTYIGGTVINSGTLAVAQNNALGTGVVQVKGGALFVEDNMAFSNTVVLAGGTYSRAVTGSLAGKVNASSDFAGGTDTTARILAGSLGTTSTLVTSFSATSAATNDFLRESDVYSFVGTGTTAFVLELSSASLDGGEIGWLSGGEWVYAIDGNTGNTATEAMQGYDGSYAEFLVAFGGVSLAQSIGAYGYDEETHAAWAVLNHNSDFAVIPEPATAGLLVMGGLVLLVRRRRA